MGFTGNVTTCTPGTTSAAFRASELRAINAFRKLVGVAPTLENTNWSTQAQAAAVAMAAAHRLSHTIDVSWPCYSVDAKLGASSSNLALGLDGPGAMVAYVADPGSNNGEAGHRRWLLCPSLDSVGLGDAPGVNATKVFQDFISPGPTRDGFVAWPNPGLVPLAVATPAGLLDRFSLQVGLDESVANTTVSVTSSQEATLGAVGVLDLVRDDSYYCSPGLVWRTSRVPQVGETWTMTVDNIVKPSTGGTRTVTWSSTFSGEVPDSTPFPDVPRDAAFATDIGWLRWMAITTGYADGTFRPANSQARDAMAAFMYRSSGSPAYTPPAVSPFTDVPTNHPFYKEISWLAQNQVSTGYADGTYRPADPIARDAMAAFLYRLAGRPAYTPPATSPFVDVSPAQAFYKEICWLAAMGVSSGWALPDGTRAYQPYSFITRDAMAAFLHRHHAKVVG